MSNHTELHRAAFALMRFFRRYVAPDEAWDEGREDEWPVDIVIGDEELAEELSVAFDRLEAALLRAGWDPITGATPPEDDPFPDPVI
jgi:hypothetical protein